MQFWTHQDQLYRREREGVWKMCDEDWKEFDISSELSALIEKEWAYEETGIEARRFEKYGPVGTWDYMRYLADMEKIEGGDQAWPRGDLDPCDWAHETGAACLG